MMNQSISLIAFQSRCVIIIVFRRLCRKFWSCTWVLRVMQLDLSGAGRVSCISRS
jgi:hypothetical protein